MEGVSFAELSDAPFTKKKIVDTAILCVAKAGVFQDDLKDWNKQDPANRTWANFKKFFTTAHREYKANLKLTIGTLFPQANAVSGVPSPNATAQAETMNALANLATATASDRVTVATLTDTIARLFYKLASTQAKLISSLMDNKKLLKRLADLNGGRSTSGDGTANTTWGGAGNEPWDGP